MDTYDEIKALREQVTKLESGLHVLANRLNRADLHFAMLGKFVKEFDHWLMFSDRQQWERQRLLRKQADEREQAMFSLPKGVGWEAPPSGAPDPEEEAEERERIQRLANDIDRIVNRWWIGGWLRA